jgi:mono/diheme cytochrome c family protein
VARRLLLVPLLLGAAWRCCDAYEPQVNYMLQCMGCHTPDGSGEPGRVPSVRATLRPFSRLEAGRRFLVQVPGVAQSTLTDAELAQLLNWMISQLGGDQGGGPFAQFSAAEVARYRATPLTDVRSARAKLIAVAR